MGSRRSPFVIACSRSGAGLEPGFTRYRCAARARQELAYIVGIAAVRTAGPGRYGTTGSNRSCTGSISPRLQVDIHAVGSGIDTLDGDLDGTVAIGSDLLHVLGRTYAGSDRSTGLTAPQSGARQSGRRLGS